MPETEKPKFEIISNEEMEELDADEQEFRNLRIDVPGVKGAAAAGIVAIGVGKTPGKNEFFRTHLTFRPVVQMVDVEIGIEKTYFAVSPGMVEPLASIGITCSPHTLYLTISSRGALRIIPARCADADGTVNEYNRTKELGLLSAVEKWKRLYTDTESVYRVFPAPEDRFPDPVWPDELKPAKIFRLAFRDRGRLIDSPQHELFQRWAARDKPE